ncbi:HEAT repeat domain-containing protein [Gimesia aquarii]|nr:HEAT repeat domain-containing protein [Gimesia aquarii]
MIYQSQTACYAKHRRKAIHKLGDKFNCECNPEIMCAFIYALNDADERVRAKAADEIGDQLRKNNCCCSPQLTAALTCALGDCDKKVVREATQALELCGYEVVEGCCDKPCCHTGCAPSGCSPSAAPAPAPTSDPKAYFPSRFQDQKQSRRRLSGNSLSNLFGLID